MSLTGIIVALVLLGVVMYLINSFIPMEPKIKQLLNIVVIIIVVIWVLQVMGVIGNINTIGVR